MLQAAVIGAGNRGTIYSSYALKRPHEIQIIAIAELDEGRRKRFAKAHNIPEHMQFKTGEELLAGPKLCDVLFICTMDRQHFGPTMLALDKGYHILLEKPMSHDPLESVKIADKAKEKNAILAVCHSMRYGSLTQELKRLIDSKVIGDVMTIQWSENVGAEHYVSSFVRGKWRNSDESSSMILQKSCHDMDMLQWLVGSKCTKVSSFGSLTHFKADQAPEGAGTRCTECAIETDCPFSAIKLYYHERKGGWYNAVSIENTLEARMKALKEGPYGRCVWHCDNNVVDHQVVNLLFENEATVSFTMSGFTGKEKRTFKIMGTKGEIRGSRSQNELEINLFSGKQMVIYPEQYEGGHSGSDFLIMRDFVAQVNRGDRIGKTSAQESARSHMIAFAAEHSRVTGDTIDLDAYIEDVKAGRA
ncbi:MAG: oxidoreductase family protein [Paenibacillaceae bacterium]|jgi:predicted dehydrogenase|nr:oxidoreductase family protein [Paenibacillaceae bacterium]